MTGDRSETGRWKEYSEELMNEDNGREPRVVEVIIENKEVSKVSQAEVRRTMKRMKSERQLVLMRYLWRSGSVQEKWQ